jgi:cell division transport system permease protein
MKLVGATSFSIQLPFILEGIFASLVGWGFSVGLLSGLKYIIDDRIAPLLTFTNFFTWYDVWLSSAYLLGTGLLVATVSSTLTLRKYLKV